MDEDNKKQDKKDTDQLLKNAPEQKRLNVRGRVSQLAQPQLPPGFLEHCVSLSNTRPLRAS